MANTLLVPYLSIYEATCHCGQHRKQIETFMRTYSIGQPCWSTYGSKIEHWDKKLLDLWVKYRERVGQPITVNSGGRCKAYNNYIYMVDGKKPTVSQHLYCKALDLLKVKDMTIDQMAKLAQDIGFNGVGKYTWGIHVDCRPNKATWDWR